MRKLIASLAMTVAAMISASPASAVLIDYNSNNGSGLNATADFSLLDSTTLQIKLTNTSAANNSQNGDANSVLSSLVFDLGTGVSITGGSLQLAAGSNYVVSTNGSTWSNVATPSQATLNTLWGFTNSGVPSGSASLDNGVSNRHSITLFSGSSSNGGSLNNGLVANGTDDIGNNRNFFQNAVILTLTLNQAISGLGFLDNGSQVEFGSGYLFVNGTPDDPDNPNDPQDPNPPVPEPATLSLLGIGLAGAGMIRRRKIAR